MRVLVVEDEPNMASLVRRALERAGFAVDVAVDGVEALWRAGSAPYDVILLDRLLPGTEGAEVCRRMREAGVRAPVLMLTALGEVTDRVGGLDAGADDYLTKPFSMDELLARVRALTRRGDVAHVATLEVGDLRLDPASHEAWHGGRELGLTAKEFALLEVFMRHPGQALSRYALLERVWDGDYEHRSNVIEAHVSALRDKIGRPLGAQAIETVRGVGYRLRRG